jgi:hypothetical protein
MSKAITELIRDANREITPADRHAILDLIEQQAARLAALESAEKENGELLTALAECRDAFPVPAAGGELEGHWVSAMANPEEVPAYVKACIESASKDAIRREAFIEAALRASIHSQYPVTTEYDRGYAKAREDAADAIRALSKKVGDQQ